MAIEMLDLNAVWGKIAAGFKGGPRWKMPKNNPNPSSFKDGPSAEARTVQQANMTTGGSVFGGKTFSSRK